jgi:hypothetical protein
MGKMGRAVESLARERGWTVTATLDHATDVAVLAQLHTVFAGAAIAAGLAALAAFVLLRLRRPAAVTG